MAATALKKITTRAKQIRKKHPGKSWKTAVKEAGREYREGGIGRARKKSPARKRKAAKVGTKRKTGKRAVRGAAVGSISTAQHLSLAKAGLKEQLAWGLLARDQAKTKTAKRKVAKKLVEVRRKLRAL